MARRLEVRLRTVADAMTVELPFDSFLDLHDGSVLEVPREEELDGEAPVQLEVGRHVAIPRSEGAEDYRVMAAFAASVDDPDATRELADALHGRGAFSRFRNALMRDLALRDRWFAFKNAADLERARAWVESHGVEVVDVSPAPPKPEPVAPPKPKRLQIRLSDVLLLGAPDGKTELLDGQVPRFLRSSDAAEARRAFADLARDICDECGAAWRRERIEGKDAFDLGRYHLVLDGRDIHLDVDIAREVWKRFAEE